MSTVNLKQSSLARVIAAANAPFNKLLLSDERTLVDEIVYHHGDGIHYPNALLRVTHDTVGHDNSGLSDDERYEEKDIEFSQLSYNAATARYEIGINGPINRASIATELSAKGFKLRPEDLEDRSYSGGTSVVEFHPDCLLYVGAITLQIATD